MYAWTNERNNQPNSFEFRATTYFEKNVTHENHAVRSFIVHIILFITYWGLGRNFCDPIVQVVRFLCSPAFERRFRRRYDNICRVHRFTMWKLEGCGSGTHKRLKSTYYVSLSIRSPNSGLRKSVLHTTRLAKIK
jgi:hypothetical protein